MKTGSQAVFRALSDPTRREILMHLTGDSLPVAEIADRFDISRTAINKHLTILEEGGLIRSRTSGRERLSELTPAPLKSALEWLGFFEQFWDSKLSNLQREIAQDMKEKKETDK